jgi:hypothetical protein
VSARATPSRNLQVVVCRPSPDPSTVFAGPASLASVRNQTECEALAIRCRARSGTHSSRLSTAFASQSRPTARAVVAGPAVAAARPVLVAVDQVVAVVRQA